MASVMCYVGYGLEEDLLCGRPIITMPLPCTPHTVGSQALHVALLHLCVWLLVPCVHSVLVSVTLTS